MTKAKTESKISGTYHELVGRKHAFTYDHQGNRKTHSRNSHTTTYTPNNLNQYTARTNHGHLLVEGTSTNATVKVYETGSTEDTATRKNNYYFRDWDPDTTSTASDYPEINIKEGTRVSDTKNAWIPAVSESPTYDANGNLTGDALWSYTYDEENRLITMTETSAAATAGFPDTTITFKYDYLGRRVEKKVVRGTTTESHLRFVWRGWLLVAELNAASNNALVKTYTWGPDISGSFGGAGGNGGVLMVEDHNADEKFFPAYDAQGNVTGLIDTSGNLDAAYEYDPFGKLIRYAGTRTTSMSLLYGTKYLDMETGLIYYGYRYYNPRQGRFINRDPIGEEGGLNLYGFVGNSPTNWVDYLGLEWVDVCEDGYTYDITQMWNMEGDLEGEVWSNFQPAVRCYRVWIPKPKNDDSGNDTGSGGGGAGGNGNGSPNNTDNSPKKEDDTTMEEEDGPDCDALRRQYPAAFLRPMEKIPSGNGAFEDVMLGATIRSAAATREGDTEYAALIEESSTGIYYREPVQGEIRFDDPNPYYDFPFYGFSDYIIGATHSHDISLSEYRKIYPLASREEYLRGVERYSTRDLILSNLFGVPLGLHTKQNHLKILDPVNGIDTDQDDSFGGIPPDVVDQIIECVNSEN